MKDERWRKGGTPYLDALPHVPEVWTFPIRGPNWRIKHRKAKLRQEGEAPSEPEADPRTLGREVLDPSGFTAVAAWILERQSCVRKTSLRLGRSLAPKEPNGQTPVPGLKPWAL